jgi:DNA repair exonuclease SbcCD ATPase subunit
LEEHAQNIEALQGRAAQLRESRQNLRLFDVKQKKVTDEKIEQAGQELARAQDFFKNRFNVDPSQAREELKRLQAEIRAKKDELNSKQIRVQIIRDKQASLELSYHTQKLLNEIHPDQEQITQLLEQMRKPSESAREQQIRERVEQQLETITDHNFEKAIEKLSQHQAQILTNIREQAKEHEELLRFEREQAFLTLYYQTQRWRITDCL